MKNAGIRNVAIIAHVDHGKTSLVNVMLKQGGVFRDNQVVEDRVMDSNALERERGITILSKNTSCFYDGVKINVVDTPGHADFGGEVERVLKMVDGVLLVVDAFEGPMPQTRFVLEKALALKLKVVVVVNKIDRPDARIKEVVDEVLELFLELDADEEQLNSPFVFASARMGVASTDMNKMGEDLKPLFETIINHIPAPEGDEKAGLKMLVSSAEHNDYVGKLAVGKVERGEIRVGQNGKHFQFYKFRSMRTLAESEKAQLLAQNESKDGVIFKMKNDPRITRVGKFIRKYSIDELPQLINVLEGNMSLVGPRPPLPAEVQQYTLEDRKRLHIKPGLTCIWQISGRSDIPFKQQVNLDKEYIRNHNFFVDIWILIKTVYVVVTGKGAY